MNIGPILFLQPLALLGLLALPVLWFLLRATPPEPRRLALPSLQLLEGLKSEEQTPDHTPLWLMLLRMLAMALAILGFARPSWAPNANAEGTGPVLVVVDDGWTSAERWRDIIRTATSEVEAASESGASAQILFTAPQAVARDPSEVLDAESARQLLRNARPVAWAPDRMAALDAYKAGKSRPGHIVWASDGFDHESAAAFSRELGSIAPTQVRIFRPKSGFAITAADSSAEGARVTLVRAQTNGEATSDVVVETEEGASIGTAKLTFKSGANTAEGLFQIPAAALNRAARFRIAGSQSAGAVWLWDDDARRPHVGFADARNEAQPLLSEHYYVRKALAPYVQITERPLEDLLHASVDAIVLGDRGAISEKLAGELEAWMEKGGVLIRFAGPRLAAQADAVTPVPLRPTSRAMGGSLAWDTPQRIAEFTADSPFFGIPRPRDAVVRQQVLAQPSAELATQTWARLSDGTPLVTASPRGSGQLILFHVTADPDWSDLPLTGTFVEMLRRSVVSGGGRGQTRVEGKGALTPTRVLDGFGVLGRPDPDAAPIDAAAFMSTRTGPSTPPGLYTGPGGERALNAGAPAPQAFTNWPSNVSPFEQEAAVQRRGVGGWLIAVALGILAIDLIIALGFAGRLPGLGRRVGATAAALMFAVLIVPELERSNAQTPDKAAQAARGLRFGYVKTSDARLDQVTRAGLFGLSYQLGQRTSVEPGEPDELDLEKDPLELYPMIYYAVPRNARPLSSAAVDHINAYLRAGGAFVIDTRDAAPGRDTGADLQALLAGIDAPPMQPAGADHVITKSYYLIKSFPGRLNGRLWVESGSGTHDTRRGDGVSGLYISGADWAGAWAIDRNTGKPLFTMTGGENSREAAYRFGINLVMYILTGNYKEDQVHIQTLLDRLGRRDGQEGNE